MARTGQEARQVKQPAQRSGARSRACLRNPETSSVKSRSRHAATQRPQPVQRASSIFGWVSQFKSNTFCHNLCRKSLTTSTVFDNLGYVKSRELLRHSRKLSPFR